jgi:hypothetical protein
VLLGFFGAGGVIGGLLMPQVRRHLSRDQTLSLSAVICATTTAILAEVSVAAGGLCRDVLRRIGLGARYDQPQCYRPSCCSSMG